MDWFKLAYTVLGGLGLFFFGMKMLSEGLQAAGSTMIRKAINSVTNNRVMAVFVGLFVTCLVQSSSVTTVMVVGFVNAGLMNLTQAIGVIFGANIGTTITGWIIAIKIGKYSLVFLGLGIFPILFSKNERLQNWGRTVFALGMVFLGLSFMSGAFKPLRTDPGFLNLMTYFAADSYFSLLCTILVGCCLTFVIQSSSAMLGITMALASSGAISFQTALALVMGENIGTTITALLAGIGANTVAKRAAAAHGLFNVCGVIVLSTFFWAYKEFIELIVAGPADLANSDGTHPNVAAHIATGHTVFNVANVIIFLPFLKRLQWICEKIYPDSTVKEIKNLEHVGDPAMLSPSMAIQQALLEIQKMSAMVNDMLSTSTKYLIANRSDSKVEKSVAKFENITDNIQKEIMIFMSEVMKHPLTSEETSQVTSILRLADELETIGDYSLSLVNYTKRFHDNDVKLDDETIKELRQLSAEVEKFYHFVVTSVVNEGQVNITTYESQAVEINRLADEMKESYLLRIKDGNYPPLASLTISDSVVALRRIKNHTVNLYEAFLGGKHTLNRN